MEFEKHNNISSFNIGSQEVYAQGDDLSFEADQENLNTSSSSDRFATPSAKLIYESISNKKQPSQNVRQTLFQNLDPLNESTTHNKSQHQSFNNAFDTTMCEKMMSNNDNGNLVNNRSTNNTEFYDDIVMDLSNHQNSDQPKQSNRLDELHKELQKEKATNEKLSNYVQQLNELNKCLSEAIEAVQDKFEATLNEKNAAIQDLTLQNSVIAKERKLAVEDVQGLENSFSELHRRYEKLKLTLESCKKKEELFQEECLAFSDKLEESRRLNNDYKQRLDILENEKSNIVETLKRQSEKEIISLRAQLKKAEMRFTGVQNQLEQKTQENLELNKMVDDLTK